jgi:hypothetical protein
MRKVDLLNRQIMEKEQMQKIYRSLNRKGNTHIYISDDQSASDIKCNISTDLTGLESLSKLEVEH